MRNSRVLAHPADKGREVANTVDRGDVAAILSLIDQHDAGGFPQDALRFGDGDRAFKLDVDCLTMADEHRHPHTGRRHLDIWIEDFAGFLHHLQLFLGVAVVAGLRPDKAVNVRDHIEGDLFGEFLDLLFVIDENRAGLFEQLVHALFAGPGNRLVGGDDDTLDRRGIVQRLQGHHHLGG